MLKNIYNLLKNITFYLLHGKKSPDELIQHVMRELNDKVPALTIRISRLNKEKKKCDRNLSKMLMEKKEIENHLAGVHKTESPEKKDPAETRLKNLYRMIETQARKRDEIQGGYVTALKQMNEYIREMKDTMVDALYRLEEQNRQHWHGRIESILKQFDIPWKSDQSLAKDLNQSVSSEYYSDKIRRAKEIISEIQAIDISEPGNEIRIAVDDIIRFSQEIVNHLRESPEEMGNARMFLTYYLDSVKEIITGYDRLLRQGNADVRNNVLRKRAEKLIVEIRKHFESLFSRMLEKDRIELDTEMEVLEKTLKSEPLL